MDFIVVHCFASGTEHSLCWKHKWVLYIGKRSTWMKVKMINKMLDIQWHIINIASIRLFIRVYPRISLSLALRLPEYFSESAKFSSWWKRYQQLPSAAPLKHNQAWKSTQQLPMTLVQLARHFSLYPRTIWVWDPLISSRSRFDEATADEWFVCAICVDKVDRLRVLSSSKEVLTPLLFSLVIFCMSPRFFFVTPRLRENSLLRQMFLVCFHSSIEMNSSSPA